MPQQQLPLQQPFVLPLLDQDMSPAIQGDRQQPLRKMEGPHLLKYWEVAQKSAIRKLFQQS
jgi:hypothetical protein